MPSEKRHSHRASYWSPAVPSHPLPLGESSSSGGGEARTGVSCQILWRHVIVVVAPPCLPASFLPSSSFLPSFAHGPVPRWTLHTTGPHGQNPPPLGRPRPHTARQGIPTSASELFGCERASAPPGREDSGERPALRGRGSSAPLRACACVTASPAAATAAVHPRPYKKIIIIFLQTAGGGARRAPPSPCFSLLSCCYS